MLSLRETQIGFARALFSGALGPGTPGIRADGLSPALRLGFYRTNVLGNYLDALRATYVAVERCVGHAHFRALAQRFIHDTPSVSGDLNRYGGEFASFLHGQPVAIDLPWLPDLAQLEWFLDQSFYAADHAPLSIERLAQVPAARYQELVFRMHPACRLLHSDYEIRRLWEACQPGSAADKAFMCQAHRDNLLIRRDGFEVLMEPLDDATFAMLEGLHAGRGFLEAYEAVCAAQPGFDATLFLQRYVGNCTLVDFHVGARPWPEDESFSVP